MILKSVTARNRSQYGKEKEPISGCRVPVGLSPQRLLDLQTHYSQRSDYFSEQDCSFGEERQLLSMNAHLPHVKVLLHKHPEIYVWAHSKTYIKRGITREAQRQGESWSRQQTSVVGLYLHGVSVHPQNWLFQRSLSGHQWPMVQGEVRLRGQEWHIRLPDTLTRVLDYDLYSGCFVT